MIVLVNKFINRLHKLYLRFLKHFEKDNLKKMCYVRFTRVNVKIICHES